MNTYIATFFTHDDAIVYKRVLDCMGLLAKMMPVPRSLSSSCGTCISFAVQINLLAMLPNDTTEMIVSWENDQYSIVIDNR